MSTRRRTPDAAPPAAKTPDARGGAARGRPRPPEAARRRPPGAALQTTTAPEGAARTRTGAGERPPPSSALGAGRGRLLRGDGTHAEATRRAHHGDDRRRDRVRVATRAEARAGHA